MTAQRRTTTVTTIRTGSSTSKASSGFTAATQNEAVYVGSDARGDVTVTVTGSGVVRSLLLSQWWPARLGSAEQLGQAVVDAYRSALAGAARSGLRPASGRTRTTHSSCPIRIRRHGGRIVAVLIDQEWMNQLDYAEVETRLRAAVVSRRKCRKPKASAPLARAA